MSLSDDIKAVRELRDIRMFRSDTVQRLYRILDACERYEKALKKIKSDGEWGGPLSDATVIARECLKKVRGESK